jgi:hypothetical protein
LMPPAGTIQGTPQSEAGNEDDKSSFVSKYAPSLII